MRVSRFASVAALLALGMWPLAGQEKPSSNRFTTEHYFELTRVSNAQISADGAHIAYVRQEVNRWRTSGNPRCGS